jgi:hypothetical protein
MEEKKNNKKRSIKKNDINEEEENASFFGALGVKGLLQACHIYSNLLKLETG